MTQWLITLTIFSVFILFNVYIRIKTFGYYRNLVKNKIQFDFKQLFNASRWNTEVISKYPEHQEFLIEFRRHMRWTALLFVAVIVLVIILLYLLKSTLA